MLATLLKSFAQSLVSLNGVGADGDHEMVPDILRRCSLLGR